MTGFYFAYGKTDGLTPSQFQALCDLDTFDSGETGFEVVDENGEQREGVLNNDDQVDMATFWAIMDGTASDISVTTTTLAPIQYSGEIISVEGGTVTIGDSDEKKSDGTRPKVTLSPFKLAKTEFTIGEAKALLAATSDQHLKKHLNELLALDYNQNKADNFALAGANYEDASLICAAFGGRLMTPEEYEFAAKHGDENRPYGVAYYKLVGARDRQQVCGTTNQLKNDEGLCDMSGGLMEMTSAEYVKRDYDTMSRINPLNKGLVDLMRKAGSSATPREIFGDRLVETRGGSWIDYDWFLRSAIRDSGSADRRYGRVGFRVAWSQDSQ